MNFEKNLFLSVCHSFMLQFDKVSFEYADFFAKMLLIFYPAFGNSKTKRTLILQVKVKTVGMLNQDVVAADLNIASIISLLG